MKLPQLYRENLAQYLNAQQLLSLEMLVCQLQIYKQMTIEGLAAHFPLPILFESRRKHIQRFLGQEIWKNRQLWLSLIQKIIESQIAPPERIYVAIDRTQWKDKNLFYVGLLIGSRAYPLSWQILEKKGASNFEEQKEILAPVIAELKEYEIVVLGDREFHGVELAHWLGEQGLYYVLREKKDLHLRDAQGNYHRIDEREIYPGIKEFIVSANLVKKRGFGEGNIGIYWRRKYRGKGEKEAWYLLTNLPSLEEAVAAYKKRMGIEEMFRDYKKGGYNLEDCQASNPRFNALLLLLAIAYTVSSLAGQAIKASHPQKFVGRRRKVKKKLTKNSDFKLGLYGQILSQGSQILEELAEQLMRLTPSKRLFYLKGKRAMSIIRQAF